MKSLLDIQQDIRNLESSMKDITACIRNINSDINELRNASRDAQTREFDYSKIAILAERIQFGEHPLERLEDGRACQMYLEMLLNIVRMDLDFETTLNRLVFIQWLQIQSRIDRSLEELFLDACEMQLDSYTEFIEILPEEYVENFMLDAFIIANIGGDANREILEYLAEMSAIFGIDIEQIQILSSIAYAVLCRKFKQMDSDEAERVLECAKKYKFYIDADMVKDAIQAQRVIAVRWVHSTSYEFRWNVKNMQRVENGDCIAVASAKRSRSLWMIDINRELDDVEMTASSSGVLFRFSMDCINYGVISISTDSKDAIKEWIKAGGM